MTVPPDDLLGALLAGDLDRLTALPDGRLVTGQPVPALVYPGSFNPLHAGHLELSRVAAEVAGVALSFELSVTNVDKPPLSTQEVTGRLRQFAGLAPVELTRQPTFAGKATLLPGTTFVVGADTARRLVESRYYGGSRQAMVETIEAMWAAGARFLVAGRADGQGRFETLADLPIPPAWQDRFTAIPVDRFRMDLSSTELRGD
jgi:hypothetical protein